MKQFDRRNPKPLPFQNPFLLLPILFLLSFWVSSEELKAQIFTANPSTEPTMGNLTSGTLQWGDSDDDGDLDILSGGAPPLGGGGAHNLLVHELVSMGTGGPTFQTNMISNSLLYLGGNNGKMSRWGDVDGDGDLDILTPSLDQPIWINQGGGSFVQDPFVSPVFGVCGDWADLDQDGDLDAIFIGFADSNSSYLTVLFNDNGAFTIDTSSNINIYGYSNLALGDYDNDQDIDVLVAGQSPLSAGNPNAGSFTKIYENDGTGHFTQLGVPNLVGLNFVQLNWVDMDNDGDLDIFENGNDTSGYASTSIYRNDGAGAFTEMIGHGLADSVSSGHESVWGDLDNDGDMDLVFQGVHFPQAPHFYVYLNNGNFTFTLASLPNTYHSGQLGSFGLADYDNDGDLDLAQRGIFTQVGGGGLTRLYNNNTSTPNLPPSIPSGLTANVAGNSVDLEWNAATDATTPSAALTYNIYVGSSPGQQDVMTAHARSATGWRKVVAPGNVLQDTLHSLHGLQPGVYFWSVQAIDNSLAPSGFATEGSFTIATDSVWPGDANADLIADNNDVLAIGFAFGQMGSSRVVQGNVWQAHASTNWNMPNYNGVDIKHSDSNGDGTVNWDDTLAIDLNYGLTHNKTSTAASASNGPLLFATFDRDSASIGDTVFVEIQLGEDTLVAQNVYGLAFTLNMDPAVVDTMFRADYDSCWIGTKNVDLLTLDRSPSVTTSRDFAFSRINQTNTSGHGTIARMGIVMLDNLSGKRNALRLDSLSVMFSNVQLISNDGSQLPWNIGSDTLIFWDVANNLNPIIGAGDALLIHPNPVKNELIVDLSSLEAPSSLALYDLKGRFLMEASRLNQPRVTIDMSRFAPGLYFLKAKTLDGRIYQRKVLKLD